MACELGKMGEVEDGMREGIEREKEKRVRATWATVGSGTREKEKGANGCWTSLRWTIGWACGVLNIGPVGLALVKPAEVGFWARIS